MPMTTIRCAEQGSPSCYRTIEVDIPYNNLDEEQIAAISMGEPFEFTAANVGYFTQLSEEQKAALEQDGCAWEHTDYSDICDPCGCESEFDKDGNQTWD